MSHPSTPAPRPAKTMSSRLMTMKFMQRAAATAAAASPPGASTPDADGHSSKRRRTGEYPSGSPHTPSSQPPSTPATAELNAISAALAAEEQTRNQALARLGNVIGETQWVLSIPGVTSGTGTINGASNGSYDDEDTSDSDSDSSEVMVGRQTFGNFKRKKASTNETTAADGDHDEAAGSTSEGSSDEDDAEDEPDTYASSRQRSQQKKAQNLAKRHKEHDKDLDAIKGWKDKGSISGNQGTGLRAKSAGGGKDFSKAFSSKKRRRSGGK